MGDERAKRIPGGLDSVCQIGLRVLSILAEANELVPVITAGMALNVEHLKNASNLAYVSMTHADPDRRSVTFAFDTLREQTLVTGDLDINGAVLHNAALTVEAKTKLATSGRLGLSNLDAIRQALAAVKAGTPPPPGTFTALAAEIGFEP